MVKNYKYMVLYGMIVIDLEFDGGGIPMKIRKRIIALCVFLLILSVWNYIENGYTRAIWGNRKVSYLKVIDKVFKYDFSGMALVIGKVSNLHGKDTMAYYVTTGSLENNFAVNTSDGDRLRDAKELFLNLKNLKIDKEGLTDSFTIKDKNYYLIQMNLDYAGRKRTDIYYLNLFVNSENNHIYIPKNYASPLILMNSTVSYVEYEPDEKARGLIESIIKIK